MNKAYIWWASLSMNEQDKHHKSHPFYGKFYLSYVLQHKNGINDLYEFSQILNEIKKS